MPYVGDLVRNLKQDQVQLTRQLELLRSGALSTGEKTAANPNWVDTTTDSVKLVERQLANVEGALARLEAKAT